MKFKHVCSAQKSLLTLYHIINKTSEPRPDMHIKVAAFTVSEKSSNTHIVLPLSFANINPREHIHVPILHW